MMILPNGPGPEPDQRRPAGGWVISCGRNRTTESTGIASSAPAIQQHAAGHDLARMFRACLGGQLRTTQK